MTGDVSNTADGFYQFAVLFHTLGAEVGLLTGLPVDTAYAIFPIWVGLSLPLFSAVLAQRVSGSTQAMIVAAIISAVGASTVGYSIATVPMMLAAVILAGAVMSLTLANKPKWPWLLIMLIFSLALTFTHKLPLLLLFGIVTAFIFYTGIVRYANRRQHTQGWDLGVAMACLLGSILTLQWLFLTDFLTVAAGLGYGVVKPFGGNGTTQPIFSAAELINPPIFEKLFNVSYYFVGVAIGGLAGLELFRKSSDRSVRALQCAALIAVCFSLPGVVFDSVPGFQRVFVYGSVFVAALIGVGTTRLRDFAAASDNESFKIASHAMVALLILGFIALNPLAVVANPDHPSSYRQYLNSGEVEGKHFTNSYIEDTVYRDYYYGDETVDFSRAADGADWHQATVPNPDWNPGLLDEELKNGTLLEKRYEYVALRTDVTIYRLDGGRYRLLWDPETPLNAEYNTIYSNGKVNIYKNDG